ncbi:MAG: class I SAM-dependent methyltransferase [Sphaerochaetaceae bacterium]|nr:class I SAM-dependent methyltransferase [Sphaerochaetaceae bacterium]
MKADYKNWVPKGMLWSFIGATVAAGVLLVFSVVQGLKTLSIVALVAFLVLTLVNLWLFSLYKRFSYDGKRQLSRVIVEGIASYVKVPDGSRCLDVGCGSGALTIACAKKNPKASFLGVDVWGLTYASYSKELCEHNAEAEGVKNTTFQQGNAVKLDFPDETFDAVVSNYVYHNVIGKNKQDLLLESLRVLKKGGTFALHDIMSFGRFGNMQNFVERLKKEGYKDVRLIDTTDGLFMSKKEAFLMELSGSSLLVGTK